MTRTPIIAQHDAIRASMAELAAERLPGCRGGADSLAADIIAMLRQLGFRVIAAEEARRETPPPPPLYPPGDGRGR